MDSDEVAIMNPFFMASRKNGKWEKKLLFDHYELSEFHRIKDEAEAQKLVDEAMEALK